MLLRRPELPYSSVTPKGVYLSRRRFFGSASAVLGFAAGGTLEGQKLSAAKSPLARLRNRPPFRM